jgi:tRNA(fMet)-specific endonuclease VapC
MKYLLDTNTCIFMMKDTPSVLAKFSVNREDGIAISAITLAELEFGVSNSATVDKVRTKLIAFLTLVDVLPFDSDSTAEYGRIRTALQKQGQAIGQLDMLIAAHAKSQRLTLVTNNTREFARIEALELEDWL